jgi:hypothetical protein
VDEVVVDEADVVGGGVMEALDVLLLLGNSKESV